MQSISQHIGILIAILGIIVAAGAIIFTFVPVQQLERRLPAGVSLTWVTRGLPDNSVSCKKATCTVNDSYFVGWVGKTKHSAVAFSSNISTHMYTLQTTVSPGSLVCIQTSTDGEVIGMGERFYDSPPVAFLADGSVIANVQSLSRYAVTKTDMTSTWSDAWHVYVDDGMGQFTQQTSLVECSTEAGSFIATCRLDAELDAKRVRIELQRIVKPFHIDEIIPVGPKYRHITSVSFRKIPLCQMRHRSNPGVCKKPAPIIMTASVMVNVDSDLPVTHCEDSLTGIPASTATDTPTPSPSMTVTPTPSPLLTTPPTMSPAYTSPPPPTEGDSEGPPIFHTD